MTSHGHDVDPVISADTWIGPGPRLKQAREAAGLALEDVAARLHLDHTTVDALETNSYEQLPAPTFVRGYLRGYARLLGLPADPIIEDFDNQGLAPPALVADISEGPQVRITDMPVRIATWVIFAGLVILVVMWSNGQKSSEPLPEQPAEPAAPIAAPADTAPALATTTEPPPFEPAVITDPAPVESVLPLDPASEAADVAEQAVEDDPAGAAVGETAPAEEPSPVDPPAGALPAGVAPAPTLSAPALPVDTTVQITAPEAVAAAAPEASPGSDRLAMTFAAESWVEVYDRDDGRLYFNLVKPDGVIDVTGPGPLRVLLGRARGVAVTHNGQPFDVTPFVAKGIARFRIGGGTGGELVGPAGDPTPAPASSSPERL